MYVDRTVSIFFFFNDTATTEIYTLSLHDALPISRGRRAKRSKLQPLRPRRKRRSLRRPQRSRSPCAPSSAWAIRARNTDRKSTRLNSSHGYISYAVFCLKKKKKKKKQNDNTK